MTINIYEPPLCCSTGVCGPEPDRNLIELQNVINALKKYDCVINRYAINQQPMAFTKNETIKNLIMKKGIAILPVTLADEKILKTGSYPILDDFKALIPDLDLSVLDEIIIQ